MAQYNRPTRTTNSPPEIWGTFGKYNKIEAVVAAGSPFIATGSRAGVGAVLVGASGVGGVTGSLGGEVVSTDLTDGVVYEIGVSQINVSAGTIYALHTNRNET